MTGKATPLCLNGVVKSLAGAPVLRAVSFECPPGAITALLGPNGAGKTTSVAVASGLRSADAGLARIFGRTPRDRRTRGTFSLVPQDIGLPAAVTVRRCLDFVAGQRAPSPLAAPGEQICERLGVGPLLQRRAGGLSGGEQRRVAVVLGLLRAPGLLIMDEATTNLDESARATTWQLVREYTNRGGAALVTSHILADIESHADRVVALSGGRVVLQSPLEQVRVQLGGSSVSLSLPAARRARVLEQVAARRLDAVPITSGGSRFPPDAHSGVELVEWRTAQPLPLVAALAQLVPEATGLQVRPIPLAEVLQQFTPAAPR
ncbi:MAG: ABC transporter ATP-binding protein [Jatrophihabitantaceae bacterium]